VYAPDRRVDSPPPLRDTGAVPPLLRSRLAFVALFAVFLIPVAGSSLRGITHVLTCREPVAAPFEIILLPDSPPVVMSAALLDPAAGPGEALCGGLGADISVAALEDGRVEVAAVLTNVTPTAWRGTVYLEVAGTRIPIDIGGVEPGETRREAITVRLPEGTTSVDGSLLLGP